ncbi:hypothetical protein ACFYXC_30205 [Streptomyces sp. NPDC002701]|uniref:hypothetical protein n=1 Tax=Streptomyces sp. NPDC002701 TaxID=3364661 RepID=UPI0036C2F994
MSPSHPPHPVQAPQPVQPVQPLQPVQPAQAAPTGSPVHRKRRTHARAAATVALFASAALIGVLAPQAAAVPSPGPALPLPLPVAAAEPLVTEGVSIEGPLLNNLTLPTLR